MGVRVWEFVDPAALPDAWECCISPGSDGRFVVGVAPALREGWLRNGGVLLLP
jgi:hypothetical protein